MKTMLNAYEILGLNLDATMNDLKRAYRVRAKLTHPDLSRNVNDSEFKLVKAAYEYLKENLGSPDAKTRKGSGFETNNCPRDGRSLDEYIKRASASDLRYKFCADIDDYENNFYSKYVLLMGKGRYSGDWGVILVAYDLSFHKNIISEYVKRTCTPAASLKTLGGGEFSIKWDRPFAFSPLLKTCGASGDFGHPQSLLAVKACLDSFVHDFIPWTKETVQFELT